MSTAVTSTNAATAEATERVRQRQWFIVSRWQEYEGEARANLLRIVGVGAFYTVELANYYGLRLGALEMPPGVSLDFHRAVTALAVAWVFLSLGVLLCLRRRVFPAVLKYLSTAGDLVLLTGVLTLADGPRSPLTVGYLLIVALAGVRFNVPLIWFTTAGAAAGYVFLLGFARWYKPELRVERYEQLLFLVAILLTGIIVGQIVRRVRGLAEDFARRLAAASEAP